MSARIPQESKPCRGLEEKERFLKTLLTEAKPLKPSNVGSEGAERKSVTGAPRDPKLCVR